MKKEDKLEMYAELLLDDYMTFAESCGVSIGLHAHEIQEVLRLFHPEQLETFMDSEFARGFLMGSMVETTFEATEGDHVEAEEKPKKPNKSKKTSFH